MKNDTMKYAVAPALHDRLQEIRILLCQAVEAHDYADAESDKRKEMAFREMMHTFLFTANRDMELITENVYSDPQAVQE